MVSRFTLLRKKHTKCWISFTAFSGVKNHITNLTPHQYVVFELLGANSNDKMRNDRLFVFSSTHN